MLDFSWAERRWEDRTQARLEDKARRTATTHGRSYQEWSARHSGDHPATGWPQFAGRAPAPTHQAVSRVKHRGRAVFAPNGNLLYYEGDSRLRRAFPGPRRAWRDPHPIAKTFLAVIWVVAAIAVVVDVYDLYVNGYSEGASLGTVAVVTLLSLWALVWAYARSVYIRDWQLGMAVYFGLALLVFLATAAAKPRPRPQWQPDNRIPQYWQTPGRPY